MPASSALSVQCICRCQRKKDQEYLSDCQVLTQYVPSAYSDMTDLEDSLGDRLSRPRVMRPPDEAPLDLVSPSPGTRPSRVLEVPRFSPVVVAFSSIRLRFGAAMWEKRHQPRLKDVMIDALRPLHSLTLFHSPVIECLIFSVCALPRRLEK